MCNLVQRVRRLRSDVSQYGFSYILDLVDESVLEDVERRGAGGDVAPRRWLRKSVRL